MCVLHKLLRHSVLSWLITEYISLYCIYYTVQSIWLLTCPINSNTQRTFHCIHSIYFVWNKLYVHYQNRIVFLFLLKSCEFVSDKSKRKLTVKKYNIKKSVIPLNNKQNYIITLLYWNIITNSYVTLTLRIHKLSWYNRVNIYQ